MHSCGSLWGLMGLLIEMKTGLHPESNFVGLWDEAGSLLLLCCILYIIYLYICIILLSLFCTPSCRSTRFLGFSSSSISCNCWSSFFCLTCRPQICFVSLRETAKSGNWSAPVLPWQNCNRVSTVTRTYGRRNVECLPSRSSGYWRTWVDFWTVCLAASRPSNGSVQHRYGADYWHPARAEVMMCLGGRIWSDPQTQTDRQTDR